MPTLLALDGNSLLHRAYHAYAASGMTNSSGKAVFATYGFMALFNGIIEKTAPHALVVAFDDPDRNERKIKWPQYKAQRSDRPDDLYEQMSDVQDLLRAMGILCVVVDGWEADDVVATVASRAGEQGWKTVIATSDRDAFSLIDQSTSVLRLVSGLDNAVLYTPAVLQEKYGVAPHQYTDFAALRGDKSDNLPGVRGIGDKTAAKLLAKLGSVEQALADRDRTTAVLGAFAERLFAGEANYRLNVEVMSQRRDLDVSLEGAEVSGLDMGRITDALHAFELPSLVSRYAATVGGVSRRSDRRGRAKGTGDQATAGSSRPEPSRPSREREVVGHLDVAGLRGVGRGMPKAEDSVPVVEIAGRRFPTSGGAAAPEHMPVTLR